MPFPGGSSDKIGNRYEGRWTACVALDVLRQRALAIRLEPPGAEGAGVEFHVRYPSRREYHQVKRQTTAAGGWTMAALARDGVLRAFAAKLADPDAVCVFVSTQQAKALYELSTHAANAKDEREYVDEFLGAKHRRADFLALSRAWGSPGDRVVFEWLRRVRVESITEETLARLVSAEGLVSGDHANLMPVLIAVLLDSVNRELTSHELWRLLGERGYGPSLWAKPALAATCLQTANERYERSRRKMLILGRVLPRFEVDTLEAAAIDHQVVVVDGIAGAGKSDVLLQFAERLHERGTPYLVFRLDRLTLTHQPEELGVKLGLPASPATTLGVVAQGQRAVLIIDQLDAISEISGRSPKFLDCIAEVVAMACAMPNLRVVLACRTFDIEYDTRFKQLFGDQGQRKTVTVGGLSLDQVYAAIEELGWARSSFSVGQLELLRVPLHLSLFAEVSAAGGRDPAFSTAFDLFEKFWQTKRNALGPEASTWSDVVETLVDDMSHEQALAAPGAIVDRWMSCVEAMVSLHVLVRDGNRIAFFHEMFFDYAFARTFIGRRRSIQQLLGEHQHLFRRAQIRQLLAHGRASQEPQHHRDLAYLIQDPSVRFHLKSVVLAWLSQVSPAESDWRLVEPLLLDEASPLHRGAWVLLRNQAWFHMADAKGFIGRQMRGEGALIDRVTWALEGLAKLETDRVVELLAPFVGDSSWTSRILGVARQVELGRHRPMFDMFLRCIADADSRGVDVIGFGLADRELAKGRPDWAAELLGMRLRSWTAAALGAGFSSPFEDGCTAIPGDLHIDEFVATTAATAPEAYMEYVWPAMVELIVRTAQACSSKELAIDAVWSGRLYRVGRDLKDCLLSGAERALREIAARRPALFDEFVSECGGMAYDTVVYLVLRGFAGDGVRSADAAVGFLLADVRRFDVGVEDPSRWTARTLLEAVLPHASSGVLIALEEFLLRFYPPRERGHGHVQLVLLEAIPAGRRSGRVVRRVGELRRKFTPEDVAPPKGIFGGMVQSPIARAAAAKMTDDQWRRAIGKHVNDRPADRYRDDHVIGGPRELAHVFEEEAKSQPVRFATLAIGFGDEVPVHYFDAALRAMADTPDPAPFPVLVALVQRCHRLPTRPCGRWIGRALVRYAGELTPEVLGILSWYANYEPDPATARWRPAEKALDVMNRGLNSGRGAIASSMADILRAEPGHFDALEDAVNALVDDPVAEVRAMAAEILCGVAESHAERSRGLFLRLVAHPDDQLLATLDVRRYLAWYGADGGYDVIRPTLTRMLESRDAEVREDGAVHICRLALGLATPRSLALAVLQSDDRHLRLGATRVYAANLADPEHADVCASALRGLFDDPDEKVREAAGIGLRRLDGKELAGHESLALAFLDSHAFLERPGDLIHALTKATAALPTLVSLTCERVLDAFQSHRSPHLSYHIREAIGLVFRAYADAQDLAEKERALDLIDRALKAGIYGMADLLSEHDRWWGRV